MESPRATGKIERILKLLDRIGTGRRLNADGLASELNVSRRTIFRDLSLLRSAGVRIRLDSAESGYEVSTMQHRLASLTDDEILSLLLNAKTSALPKSEEQQAELDRAIFQLGATLEGAAKARADQLNRIAVSLRDSNERDYRADIDTLLEAIVSERPVSITAKANVYPFEAVIRIVGTRIRLQLGQWVLDGVRLRDHAKVRIPLAIIDDYAISRDDAVAPLATHLREWTSPDITFRQAIDSAD